MSAFACNSAHIGQLAIRFAENRLRLGTAQLNAQQWAQALAWANINSLIERYGEEDAQFMVNQSFTDYVVACSQASRCIDYSLTPIAIISMAHCFDYQACEYHHYTSATLASQGQVANAYTVGACHVQQLINAMIRQLPGYDDAPYSYSGEGAPQAVRIA